MPVQLVEDQAALDALVASLGNEPILAVDCEMDSMFAYRSSLCLVQLGWSGGEALIDAMVDLDRSALGVIFADPAVVKVFHGGENDIGLLCAQWGFEFESVFDTMVASQVLGLSGVGLAAALKRHFDVFVSKRWQKADWRVRPLPDGQAEYARMDVRWLAELRRLLLDELERLDRVEEAESEFERIRHARHEAKPFDPEAWGRCKSARKLPAALRGVFREVFVARDEIAAARNWAPYRIMQESTLVQLAQRQPTSVERLADIRGVSRRLRPEELGRLVAAVKAGEGLGEISLPKSRRSWNASDSSGGSLSPEQQDVFDALRAWRSKRAAARGVDVARVATNVLLGAIARAHPKDQEALAAVKGVEPWRIREYGQELVALLRDVPQRS